MNFYGSFISHHDNGCVFWFWLGKNWWFRCMLIFDFANAYTRNIWADIGFGFCFGSDILLICFRMILFFMRNAVACAFLSSSEILFSSQNNGQQHFIWLVSDNASCLFCSHSIRGSCVCVTVWEPHLLKSLNRKVQLTETYTFSDFYFMHIHKSKYKLRPQFTGSRTS